jgi:hypothetical protein
MQMYLKAQKKELTTWAWSKHKSKKTSCEFGRRGPNDFWPYSPKDVGFARSFATLSLDGQSGGLPKKPAPQRRTEIHKINALSPPPLSC